MSWRVLVRAENPDPLTLSTLEELTGLGRGEVLLALRRNGVVAGEGFPEERARALAASLSEMGMSCQVVKAPTGEPGPSSYRVVLTGYQPGQRARLRERLQKLSGLPPEQVVVWLSRIPFVLRDGIDHETARRIRKALVDSGGIVEIVTAGASSQPAPVRRAAARAPAPAAGPESAASAAPKPVAEAAPQKEKPLRKTPPPPQEPPVAELEAPPVLPVSRGPDTPPGIIRFHAPGRRPEIPPVAPDAAALEMIPPVTTPSPPVVCRRPPARPGALGIYLHGCSEDAGERFVEVLCGRLDFRPEEAWALLGTPRPVRIACTASREKASELAGMLETPGITVGIAPASLRPGAASARRRGFVSWLNPSDG